MHPGQLTVTPAAVGRLVAEQFPPWAGTSVEAVRSHGTVNALFRIGDDLLARFPLLPTRRDELAAEQEHARWWAAQLPIAGPEPVALGDPGPGYDGAWAMYRWLEGESADDMPGADSVALAADLAAVVRVLHGLGTGGRRWPGHGRGGPLVVRDDDVRAELDRCRDLVDSVRVADAWSDALAAPAHDGRDRWIHTDLMPGNLLLRDGRLAAVLDLGTGQVGDPAVDLMPAWNLFTGAARRAFRDSLQVDDATWSRGRGWAIVQAVPCVAYYRTTNPVMSSLAVRTLAEILGR